MAARQHRDSGEKMKKQYMKCCMCSNRKMMVQGHSHTQFNTMKIS